MTNLATVLDGLGWSDPQEQVAMVRLLCFCGKGEELLPGETVPQGTWVGVHQARAVAENPRLFPSSEAALEWLHTVLQELFYTTQDYRSLKPDAGFFGQHRERILPLLAVLGMSEARLPERQSYDFLLVTGGTEGWATLRLRQLQHLADAGTEVGHVVLLGSTRLLMPELERESLTALLSNTLAARGNRQADATVRAAIDKALESTVLQDIEDIYARNIAQAKAVLEETGLHFADWPTEADMLELRYGQMRERLPDAWQSLPVHIVNSPMIRRADHQPVPDNNEDAIQQLLNGDLRRANTHDTLRDFAALPAAAHGGSVLSISHQPYALHQHGQLRAALPAVRFPVAETVAERVPLPEVNVHHALGCLAKYLYAMREPVREKLQAQAAQRGQ